jgi:hypothetical protein
MMLLLTLAIIVGLRALQRPPDHVGSRSGTEAAGRGEGWARSLQHTVVYLVSSDLEATDLNSALTEWRMEMEALGTSAQQPRRVVVVQTREEVLRQRVIDFAILAAQAPGLDLEVVDLRN